MTTNTETKETIEKTTSCSGHVEPVVSEIYMTLDEELKAAGMLTVSELMAGQPLDGFQAHKNIDGLKDFSAWLDMRTKEMLRMKARLTLDGKDESELFEWVLGHCAILNEVRLNFNQAKQQTVSNPIMNSVVIN